MLRLTKHHGLGNDFLVALADLNPDLVPDPSVARSVCDRRRGIGADGLILSLAPSEPEHDSCMVLLNADGSEAEISGNGIRCLGQALLRHQGRSEGDLMIETSGGVRHLRTVRGEADGEVWMQVDMGPASAGPELGEASSAYAATRRATRDIGNPHLVLLVDDPEQVDLATDGPLLEADYPDGMNVHFVAPLGPDEVRLRVWERGAGITEACGSGATVAAAVMHEWGLVGERVRVSMPGGETLVDVTEHTLLLTGPATFVAEVSIP
ncbi:diaminopimelate epimerase [soil metagenome]